MHKKPSLGSFIAFALVLFLLGFGMSFTLQNFFPLSHSLPDFPSTQQTQDVDILPRDRHFFSDDFLVYGKDNKGVPFYLKLSLNRKQKGENRFIHYYFSNILYGNINKTGYVDFYSDTSDISAQEIFLSYKHQKKADFSSREQYDFLLKLPVDNVENDFYINVDVAIDELSGDFLIRNRPEYTKYASVGTASIQVGDKDNTSFSAQVFVSGIYSDDYSTLLFFEGYDDVQPTTDYLAFWDDNNSFYLIDHTVTKEENPYYQPHTWILYKDGKGDWMKKTFELEINFEEEAGLPKRWSMAIPAFEAKILMETSQLFENSQREGVGKGTVTTPEGTFNIEGFVERHT